MTLEEHFGLALPPFPKAVTEASLLRHSALQEVLEKLRFALARDTIALLVAESGCGKSTALALFAKSLRTRPALRRGWHFHSYVPRTLELGDVPRGGSYAGSTWLPRRGPPVHGAGPEVALLDLDPSA